MIRQTRTGSKDTGIEPVETRIGSRKIGTELEEKVI